MTFLNTIMLLGLVAVAMPVVIHLLNRRRARVVEWGAMRFLLQAAASQTRNIRLQEMLLLLFRCGWLAMLAMALALPIAPSRSTISWWLVLPLVLAGAAGMGLAGGWNSGGRVRMMLACMSAGLILAGAGLGAYERWQQGKLWDVQAGAKDVAIVIDGSSSMTARVAEPPSGGGANNNFAKAVEEARCLLNACGKSDTAGIILGGPVGRRVTPGCISDRTELESCLNSLAPAGGTMDGGESLLAAADCLADGPNMVKEIVVITDGQRAGWDGAAADEAQGQAEKAGQPEDSLRRWRGLAGKIRERLAGRAGPDAAMPRIVLRLLPLAGSQNAEGRTFSNLAVDDLAIRGRPPGLDRPAEIAVTVANTGQTAFGKRDIIIYEDGREISRQAAGPLQPGASQTVVAEHAFARPGHVVLRAVLEGRDDLADDDSAWRVFEVASTLGVLIVDGRGVAGAAGQAAENLAVALAPGSGLDYSPAGPRQPASRSDDEKFLFHPEIVPAGQVEKISDLGRYNLVVLADVGSLPAAWAGRLEAFIRRGGGLWIVPGPAAEPGFYNGWTGATGLPVAPAELGARQVLAGNKEDNRPAVESLAEPALISAARCTGSDFHEMAASAIWRMKVNPADRAVSVPAALRSGLPLFAERRMGKGIVLMSALAADNSDSNLPRLKCFVPLVHELAMELCLPSRPQWNIRPGRTATIELPADAAGMAGVKSFAVVKLFAPPPAPGRAAGEELQIVREWPVPPERSERTVRAGFSQTREPGLYGFIVPRTGAGIASVSGGISDRRVRLGDSGGLMPFTVLGDTRESRMNGLVAGDFDAMARGGFEIAVVSSTGEALACLGGQVPGQVLWRQFLLAAAVCMFCELAMARFIASRRRLDRLGPVQLSGSPIDMAAFRGRARQMLSGGAIGGTLKRSEAKFGGGG
ncbi:MAG: BatA domain-containing protein [Planctomycetes bacterium]|nr:BatA domain-containing protein [Planctomycetota bacterium]